VAKRGQPYQMNCGCSRCRTARKRFMLRVQAEAKNVSSYSGARGGAASRVTLALTGVKFLTRDGA
jgi:hypothetical protein